MGWFHHAMSLQNWPKYRACPRECLKLGLAFYEAGLECKKAIQVSTCCIGSIELTCASHAFIFCIHASHTIQPCITKASPCGYHMEAYGSIMQYTYCNPCNITKQNTPSNTIPCSCCIFFGTTRPSPPKNGNSKQNSQHLLFLFGSWFLSTRRR